MPRNSFLLAAFAAASVPGLDPVKTVAIPTPADDVDVAGVVGEDGRRVLVTCPRSTAAGVRMEKDLAISAAMSAHALSDLVPSVLGSVKLPGGGRAAVTDVFDGAPLAFDRLLEDSGLAASLGTAIARIHEVPRHIAEGAGAEQYSPAALREQYRAQLLRAQRSEPLPAAVLQRWQAQLADDALWALDPVLVHGDLSDEALFARDGRITGVRSWSSARIADPAADLAWLASTLETDRFDALMAAYAAERRAPLDPRLVDRAHVLSEFAIIDWLLHGIDTQDEVVIDDARAMLHELDDALAQIAKDEAEEAYAELAAPAGPGELGEPVVGHSADGVAEVEADSGSDSDPDERPASR